MINDDVIDLYDRVGIRTRVVVLASNDLSLSKTQIRQY